METRRGRHSWKGRGTGVLLVLLTGCLGPREKMGPNLLSNQGPDLSIEVPADAYQVHCPDVLEISVNAPAHWKVQRRIGPDGRIDLGEVGRLRVDGLTTAAIQKLVAKTITVSTKLVQVKVAEFNSQQVYLHGEVRAPRHVVAYRGPETVVELLRREGGLSIDAAPGDIQVIRGNVADGGAPEVYHVKLEAILKKNDHRTNVRLQPFDQVYVGESRRCCLARIFPPWMHRNHHPALKDQALPLPSHPAGDSQSPGVIPPLPTLPPPLPISSERTARLLPLATPE